MSEAKPEALSFATLQLHERSVYSQGGEDGVLEQIFATIGPGDRRFVEFGAWDGLHLSNSANLRLHHGWRGLLLEGSERARPPLVQRAMVDADNVCALFDQHGVPPHFDLLSIDIDGNDYWVWRALERHRARVVVIEYNALFALGVARTMPYRRDHRWDDGVWHGASLTALRKLGHAKGYALVYTDRWVPNAFFVAREAVPPGYVEPPIERVTRGVWFEQPPGTRNDQWVAV